MFATSPGIVTAAFPAAERGRALGLNLSAVYLGLTAGPVLGGLIVAHTSWRWIFFINVPIAVATVAAGWGLLGIERRSRAGSGRPASTGRADWPGAVLLGGTLTALFIPLTFSPLWGWASWRSIGLLAAAVVLLVAFVLVESRQKAPMVDLDLLRKNRVFALANSATLLNYVAIFAVTTLTAVYLEITQGRSAQAAGLILLVQPVLMASISPFTGRLSDRIGTRAPATAGMVLIAAGMVQLAFASSTGRVLLALGTVGVGIAGFSSPNMSAIMGSVGRSQLGLAAGFVSATRFCGQGISMAVLGAIAAHSLGPEGGRIIFLGESGGVASAAAFADGFQAAMLVGAALALIGAGFSWKAAAEHTARGDASTPGT
jgi:MFS family permease